MLTLGLSLLLFSEALYAQEGDASQGSSASSVVDAESPRAVGLGERDAVPVPARPNRPTIEPRLSIYLRPDVRVNPGFQAGQEDTEVAIHQRIRAGVRAERGLVSALVELQEVRSWGERGSSTSAEAAVFAYQGYVQFGDDDRWFRVGRQELHMLNGFYLSKAPWNPSGRSFDAMRGRWEGDQVTVEAFSAMLTPSAARSEEQSKPTKGDTLSAVYLTLGTSDVVEPTLFTMVSTGGPTVDEPERKKLWVAPAFRLFVTPGLSKFDLNGMVQVGKDTEIPISTYDVIVRFDQGFELAGTPGIALLFEQASGSGQNDEKDHNFNLHFGRNHYLRGAADQVLGENIRWVGIEAYSMPWESIKPVVQAHLFQLTNPNGVWLRNGNNVQGIGSIPRNQDPNLGVEFDAIVYANLDEHVKFDGGYTFFQPIGVGSQIAGSDAQHTLFLRSRFSF